MARLGGSLARTMALIGLVSVGSLCFVASMVLSGPIGEQRADAQAAVDQLELLDVRLTFARAHQDEVVTRLGEPLDAPARGSVDLDALRATTVERLDAMGSSVSRSGVEANILAAEIRDNTSTPADQSERLWWLTYLADAARFAGSEPPPESLEYAAFVDGDAIEIVNEMTALQLNAQGVTDPSIVSMAGVISPAIFLDDFLADGTEAGDLSFYAWQEDGFADSSPFSADLLAIINDSPMARYSDDLVRVAAGEELHTPEEFATYRADMVHTIDAIRGRVDAELMDRSVAAKSTLEAIDRRSALTTVLRFGGLAALIVGLGLALEATLIHSRQRLEEAALDPLTGLGNRRMLEEVTARHLARVGNHAVVMLDLDRFKLVNDGHGHGVGDQVLVAIANGLKDIAAGIEADASTLVRQGGDEFLLSLHSERALDVDHLRSSLDRLRTQTIAAPDGTQIPLAFSYGIAQDFGTPDIASMVNAADLAAYEDKAVRREGSSSGRAPGRALDAAA